MKSRKHGLIYDLRKSTLVLPAKNPWFYPHRKQRQKLWFVFTFCFQCYWYSSLQNCWKEFWLIKLKSKERLKGVFTVSWLYLTSFLESGSHGQTPQFLTFKSRFVFHRSANHSLKFTKYKLKKIIVPNLLLCKQHMPKIMDKIGLYKFVF